MSDAGVYGKRGGLRLAKAAEDITMAEIYLAISLDKKMFSARDDIETDAW